MIRNPTEPPVIVEGAVSFFSYCTFGALVVRRPDVPLITRSTTTSITDRLTCIFFFVCQFCVVVVVVVVIFALGDGAEGIGKEVLVADAGGGDQIVVLVVEEVGDHHLTGWA